MNISEFVAEHIEVLKHTKIDGCRRNNGPMDLQPMMVWLNEHDDTNIAILETKGENTLDYVPQTFGLLTQQNPKFVIFMAESLARVLDKSEVDQFLGAHIPGDLQKEHKSRGPLSGIKELIAFNGLDTDTGEQVHGFMEFAYDDFGIPVFSEPRIDVVSEDQIDKANMTFLFREFYKIITKMREIGL